LGAGNSADDIEQFLRIAAFQDVSQGTGTGTHHARHEPIVGMNG
jgi:hypothetical protein